MQFSEGIRDEAQVFTAATRKRNLLKKLKALRMAADELLKQYAAGERDFQGINLSDQILCGIDLEGADLSGAKLHQTVLERANLTRVNFCNADLTGADLRGADLTEANLRQAKLQKANLRGVDLSWADLRGADLTGADLGGAIMPDGSILLTSEPSSLLIFSHKRSQS